ncbi:GNAT family N-acetyltransferase [Candidatus Pacearchaeota archaeon]|nr:GNAT family N-acetyltransferase [Candidatus Pacearchaeota archaeon]
MIKKDGKLIGQGKFLWRNLALKNKKIKLAAFGLIIDREYQGKGLGKNLVQLQIKEAVRIKADILYGTTKNPIAEKILKNLGFVKIDIPVFYIEVLTKKKKKEENNVYVLEIQKGILDRIRKEKKLLIGDGLL